MNIPVIVGCFTCIATSYSLRAQNIKQDTSKPIAKVLMVINGKERSELDMSNLDSVIKPNQITSINVDIENRSQNSIGSDSAKDANIIFENRDLRLWL